MGNGASSPTHAGGSGSSINSGPIEGVHECGQTHESNVAAAAAAAAAADILSSDDRLPESKANDRDDSSRCATLKEEEREERSRVEEATNNNNSEAERVRAEEEVRQEEEAKALAAAVGATAEPSRASGQEETSDTPQHGRAVYQPKKEVPSSGEAAPEEGKVDLSSLKQYRRPQSRTYTKEQQKQRMAVRGRRRIAKTDPVPVGDVARPAHKTTAPVDSDLAEAVFAQTCDHDPNASVEQSETKVAKQLNPSPGPFLASPLELELLDQTVRDLVKTVPPTTAAKAQQSVIRKIIRKVRRSVGNGSDAYKSTEWIRWLTEKAKEHLTKLVASVAESKKRTNATARRRRTKPAHHPNTDMSSAHDEDLAVDLSMGLGGKMLAAPGSPGGQEEKVIRKAGPRGSKKGSRETKNDPSSVTSALDAVSIKRNTAERRQSKKDRAAAAEKRHAKELEEEAQRKKEAKARKIRDRWKRGFRLLKNHGLLDTRCDDQQDEIALSSNSIDCIPATKFRFSVQSALEQRRHDPRGEELLDACEAQDLAAVKALLCDNVDPEYRDDEGYTALMFAATSNFLGGVKELVANGADINRASLADGSTALHISAQYGHTDIVKFLLAEGAVIPERHGALIEYEDEAVRGVSALYMASQEGHTGCVKAILDAQCELNHVTKEGVSSLYIAAKGGHLEVVKLLVRERADLNVSTAEAMANIRQHDTHEGHDAHMLRPDDITHKTPLSIARACGHNKVAFFLLAHGAKDDDER